MGRTGAVGRGREENLRMLSIPDMAVIGTVALLVFGPDQLPKVARKAGQVMRDLQNTSQSFIREMERAADADEEPAVLTDTTPAHAFDETVAHAAVTPGDDAPACAAPPEPPPAAPAYVPPPISAAPAYHETPAPARSHAGQSPP